MKSLRVFVCILVSTFTLFGGFVSLEKARAQSTPVVVASIQMIQESSRRIFSQVMDKLNPSASVMDKNLAILISDAKNAYDRNVNTAKLNGGTATQSAKDIYVQSLKLAQDIINQKKIDPKFQDVRSKEIISALLTQIQNEIDTQGLLQNFSTPTASSSELAAATRGAAGIKAPDTVEKCSLGIIGGTMNVGACITEAVTWLIKNTLLQIAGFLVWLSANMLNYSIQIGILNFKDWAPDTLYSIWMIVRQIISLLIVFAGLYLGFLYILGDANGKFEKYLPWVVMFALFVNFSYPLARTAIDISNIISLKVYTSAVGNNTLTSNLFSSNDSAGALIMSKLGLQGLIGSAVTEKQSSSIIGEVNSIPGALMAVIFTLYTAYIFFIVTGIIAIRTAVLVFLTIASPILLVDSVLPVLGEKAKMLRKVFFEQLAVGPVFMVMLALTLKFLDVFNKGLSSVGSLNTASGNSNTIVTFFNILMMLIMLNIMIKVTKHVAGTVGTYATNAMGTVGGFGLGVASGGAGLLARKGIGSLALKAKESGWVQKNQDTFMGRRALQLSNSLANSSFDLRNSSVVAGKMNKIGMGMGMGAKLGYEGQADENAKKIAERSRNIKVRHTNTVYEIGADGKEDKTRIKHKEGEVDHAATAEARKRYAEVRGGNGTVFHTKEQLRKIDEQLKTGKGEEMNAMVEEYKKFENTPDGRTRKKEFYDKQSKEIQERLKRHDREFTNEILSEYRELDETAEGRARKQAFFDKQGEEVQERLTRYDQEEQKKKDKETGDQKNKDETLQAQKDLAQAQKDQVEVSRKQAELQQQQIDLMKRQNVSGTQGTPKNEQPRAETVTVSSNPEPLIRKDKEGDDLANASLENEEQTTKRVASLEPSLETDEQVAKRLGNVDVMNDNVLNLAKRTIDKARNEKEKEPVT